VGCRHHHYRHHSCSRRGGAGKRILYILAVGIVVAASVSVFRGRSDRYVSPPPTPAKLSGMSASKLQGYAAESAIVAGAAAAEKELASLPPHADPTRTFPVNVAVPPTPEPVAVTSRRTADQSPGKPKPAIKTRVRSDKLYTSREMALNDALVKAGLDIQTQLRELDPPIEARPSWDKVRREYLRPESVTYPTPSEADKEALAKAGLDPNGQWAEIEVELTDDDIRDLRSEQRLGTGGVVAGVVFVLVLALFGFLRLDAWTKGYLTGGLAVAVVAAAGAAVALLVLA
jgi:hypothetical protein